MQSLSISEIQSFSQSIIVFFSEKFTVSDDTQVVISQSQHGVHAYVSIYFIYNKYYCIMLFTDRTNYHIFSHIDHLHISCTLRIALKSLNSVCLGLVSFLEISFVHSVHLNMFQMACMPVTMTGVNKHYFSTLTAICNHSRSKGGIRGSVVERWTAGQQVE